MKVKNLVYPIMLLATIAAFLYPGWIKDGYLGFDLNNLKWEDLYSTIGVFIATYGSLIASYTWWYKQVWKKRKK